MKFSHSRPVIARTSACLFVSAQTVAFAQTYGPRLQAVVTKTDAYLPGAVQLIASANADDVILHPQGRYVLIKQNEAALPLASFTGKPTTGATSLLLYDARLRKTRTLWERRDDGGKHSVSQVEWLAGTDCAVVTVFDTSPIPQAEKMSEGTTTLLFFDFGKSTTPRVLATSSSWGLSISVSPTKPLFTVQDDHQLRMGSAPRGTFGPGLAIASGSYNRYPEAWSADGTSIYGTERVISKSATNEKPRVEMNWREWDGKSSAVASLDAKPTKAQMAQPVPPPALPVALRSGTLTIPTSLVLPTPPQTVPSPKPAQSPTAILHPLYLEALSDPTTPAANPNHSTLLAPDADEAYLLADQSAVLYQSSGALYAVPLVRVNLGVYAQVQKEAAIQNAKQVGLGILMYTQDYDEVFPPQDGFPKSVGPYLRNDAAFQGFTYLSPGTVASVTSAATTVMGFIAAPGGRAVVYVDGHVKWEDIP